VYALRWANLVFFILAFLFSIFPVITEKAYVKASFYLGTAFVALFIFIIACFKTRQIKNGEKISSKLINFFILLYYVNVMFFGLYLAVWAEPEKIAGSFIGIFICVLFLLNISPVYYLCLTISTLAFYTAAIISVKTPSVWNYDIQNAFFAAVMSLIFGWQIIMNRMTMMSKERKLKDENSIDELTHMKNRRDFMKTIQRFVTNHRQSDNFLCIAIADIDFFKNYNDYYGHPKGDECLRIIGKTFNDLCRSDSIYTARVGGEEFALLWHSKESSEADAVGLRVNQLIRNLNIPHEKSKVVPFITVSIGIHIAKCGIPHDIMELYNLADKALYTAKENGRNCTVVSS
jgi:diguanylate cyclase (GGDEF)-like protein